MALHGRTGDGSRLVQIKLADPASRPFFASAGNVLIPPVGGAGSEERAGHRDGSHEPTTPALWLTGSGRAAHIG